MKNLQHALCTNMVAELQILAELMGYFQPQKNKKEKNITI